MKTRKKNDNKNSWVIGGTTMLGLGVGFILLSTSALYFVASLIIGIALGIIIAPFVPAKSTES